MLQLALEIDLLHAALDYSGLVLNVDELLAVYLDGRTELPADINRVVERTRDAAGEGRALEVLRGLALLHQFAEQARPGQ